MKGQTNIIDRLIQEAIDNGFRDIDSIDEYVNIRLNEDYDMDPTFLAYC